MTKNVQVIHPNALIHEAAEKMRSENVGALPVCNGTKLEGMLTDRDLVIRALAARKDPRQTRVSDVMSADIIYSFEDQSIVEAAEMMRDKNVQRLVVLDHDKNMVGVVSLTDLTEHIGRSRAITESLENFAYARTGHSKVRSFGQKFASQFGWMSMMGASAMLLGFYFRKQRPLIHERIKRAVSPNREPKIA
jgi:predicted transcriptional regulator